MRAKFEELLNDIEKFTEKRIEISGKIADLQQNGIKTYSHEKIETDCNNLQAQLQAFANEKHAEADKIIESIKTELEAVSMALDLAELQSLFVYLQSAGEKASVPIIENQVSRFAGNEGAITSIREVAENSGCTMAVVNIIKSYYASPETVAELLSDAVTRAYAGASATESGKKIEYVARHCGANVTCTIVDEHHDNMLLRKAFGLA